MFFKVSNINQYTHKQNTNKKREKQGELSLHMHAFPVSSFKQTTIRQEKKARLAIFSTLIIFFLVVVIF